MSTEINNKIEELKKELAETTQKLLGLKTIKNDRELLDMVRALNDLGNSVWFGNIRLLENSDSFTIELYEGETYIYRFDLPKTEPISKIKQTIQEKRAEIIIKVLDRVARELHFLEETKLYEKMLELEGRIEELEKEIDQLRDP